MAKKLKCSPAEAQPKSLDPMEDWIANVFSTGRRQFISFTNTSSLFSVIFPGKGINSTRTLLPPARRSLESLLTYLAVSDPASFIFPEGDSIESVCKVGNRSVQGSINEMIYHAAGHISDGVTDLNEVARRINGMPMFSLPGIFPNRVHLSGERVLTE